VRRHVFSGFVVPLALALLTSLVVFRIVSSYERDFARVNETSVTSAQLNALIKTVVDAETGERGFVITGDQTYLEPYFSSTTEFGVTLSALRASLKTDANRETLSHIDSLFERWHREVAEVVIGARRRAPVELAGALRGASTAFSEARTAITRYQLTRETALLSRSGRLLGEAERQLERALKLGVVGPKQAATRAATDQVEAYRRETSTLSEAQALDDTLGQLAADAEAAEKKVTALIRVGAGKRLIDEIRAQVAKLSEEVNTDLENTLAASTVAIRRTEWAAFFGPLFAALISSLAILQGQKRLSRSVEQLGEVVGAVAAGQLERRLTLSPRDDLRPLAENFNRMANRLSEREQQNAQLGQFSSTLQTCTTTIEAYGVTERFAPQLFGGFAGALYRINSSRNLLEEVARWGDETDLRGSPHVHPPSDCWALRRGSPQMVRRAGYGLRPRTHTRPGQKPLHPADYPKRTAGPALPLQQRSPNRSKRSHRTLCRNGRRTARAGLVELATAREFAATVDPRPAHRALQPAASGRNAGDRIAPRGPPQ